MYYSANINKIVVLGSGNVGKTKLAERLQTDSFKSDSEATIGASFFTHTLDIDNKHIKISLWDTSGQERYFSILPMYIRHAKVILICTDNNKDIETLQQFVKRVQNTVLDDPKIYIVITKVDLVTNKQVHYKKIKDYAESNNYEFGFTSAKTGEGVRKLFYDIGKYFINNKRIFDYDKHNTLQLGRQQPKKSCFRTCSM